MSDSLIACPQCGHEFKLTETLARPLVEAARQKFEGELRTKESALAQREAALRTQIDSMRGQQEALTRQRRELEAEIAAKVQAGREQIAREEAARAAQAAAGEMQLLRKQFAEQATKLAEAQQNELQLRAERQRLHEERERFELEKQRAIDAERQKIREAAFREANERQRSKDDEQRLKEAEKDKMIADLRGQIDDMRRKVEQGSQQVAGEVQELDLEAALRAAFPRDAIDPVPKGVHGGDVLQRVPGPTGTVAGTILWESKRTRNWSDGWLAKLRGDQREARADVAVILTAVLPKSLTTFGRIDDVWITSYACALPLAAVLRQALAEVAAARSASQGRQTKMEQVYEYMTGPAFRRRMEAIKEAFETMSADLEAEKKVITRQWAKRQQQIENVLLSAVGMYGDLQGIAGQTLPEIEGFEFRALEARS